MQEVSKFMYLYNHNNIPEQLSHIFTHTINIHAHNTRIMQHIRPIRSQTSLNSILYKGPLVWNGITAETREKRHVHCFIRSIKKRCLNEYAHTIYTNICFIHLSITPLVSINNTKMLFYVIKYQMLSHIIMIV